MKDVHNGTVIWFDACVGYGFIEWSLNGNKQNDLFLHFSDITCEGFKTVKKGQKVSFTMGMNNSGRPKACDVVVLQ